jgi:hypothetical protein
MLTPKDVSVLRKYGVHGKDIMMIVGKMRMVLFFLNEIVQSVIKYDSKFKEFGFSFVFCHMVSSYKVFHAK